MTQQALLTEKVFLDRKSVQVTKTRFIVPGETYAMSGIISVKTAPVTDALPLSLKDKAVILGQWWLLAIIFSQLAYIIHQNNVGNIIMVILLLASSWIIFSKKPLPVYSVILKTSSGEVKAIESWDSEFIEQVTQAINEAIVARG